MRRPGATLVPLPVLIALASACFARLVADPDGPDRRRPSGRASTSPTGAIPARRQRPDVLLPAASPSISVAKVVRNSAICPPGTLRVRRPADGRQPAGRPLLSAGLARLVVRCPSALGWLTVGHLLWGGPGTLSSWPGRRASAGGRPRSRPGCFQASPYLLAQTFEGHYPARLGGLLVPLGVLGVRGVPDRAGSRLARLPPILA